MAIIYTCFERIPVLCVSADTEKAAFAAEIQITFSDAGALKQLCGQAGPL